MTSIVAVVVCATALFLTLPDVARATHCTAVFTTDIGLVPTRDGVQRTYEGDCTGRSSCSDYFEVAVLAGDRLDLSLCDSTATWRMSMEVWGGGSFTTNRSCGTRNCNGDRATTSWTAPSAQTVRVRVGGWLGGDRGTYTLKYTLTPASVCGDGTMDPGEACDDENTDNCDGCSADCTESGTGLGTPGCWTGSACVPEGDDNPLNECEYCNSTTGSTTFDDKASGVDCDNGLYCDGDADECNGSGSCVGGSGAAIECDDAISCTADSCSEDLDRCVFPVRVGCLIDGDCVSEGLINPDNECQICRNARDSRAWSGVAGGTPCDDGEFCTPTDTCDGAGDCGGPVRSCDDGLDCTADTCDEAADACSSTLSFGCVIDGMCVMGGALDPTNSCQACQPLRSTTAWSPLAAGTTCDDGLYCTVGETCDGAASCAGSSARDCDDGVACTADTCDDDADACSNVTPASTCTIDGECVADGAFNPDNPCEICDFATDPADWTLLTGGESCDDGLFCTSGDVCDGTGTCGGTPRSCDDSLTCTADSCDETADACVNALSAGCLIDGTCLAEGAANPANPCEACDSASATDAFSPAPAGTSCDDGSACTMDDVCDAAGACTGGAAVVCDDGLDCTTDTCDDASGGCTATVSDGCLVAGACVAEGEGDPDDACRACDPETRTDGYSARAVGERCGEPSCEDGDLTMAPTCDADGLCVEGAPGPCPDGFLCADDTMCAGSCEDDLACISDYFCDGDGDSICVADLDTGAPCDRDEMCADGMCIDGYCCDGECDGECEACNVDGAEGECSPIAEGEDPDDECDGDLACDGASACEHDPMPDAGMPGDDAGTPGDDDAGPGGTDAGRLDGGTAGGDGGGVGTDAGPDIDTGGDGGCGCVIAGQRGPEPARHAAWLALLGAIFLLRRRRR